jgi:hypothetical protein
MRPFLEDRLPPVVVVEWPDASTEWHNRQMAKEPGSARLIAIAQAPAREKPRMLLRAVFLTTEAGGAASCVRLRKSFGT